MPENLICERLPSAQGELTLSKDSFLRMCRSSYTTANAATRVTGAIRLCKNCLIGQQNAENAEIYPTNIKFSDD